MSIAALNWAFDLLLTGATKWVLVVLANHADEANACYPSAERIGRMAGVDERTVRRILKQLEADAWLTIDQRPGRKNRYVLAVGAVVADGEAVTAPLGEVRVIVQPVSNRETAPRNPGRGARGDTTPGVTPRPPYPGHHAHPPRAPRPGTPGTTPPEPSLTITEPPPTTNARDGGGGGADFETFVKAYPRKQNRAVVELAWTLATAYAEPAVILAGLERFQFDSRERFVPMPTTWLRDQRWEDAREAAPQQPGTPPRQLALPAPWLIRQMREREGDAYVRRVYGEAAITSGND